MNVIGEGIALLQSEQPGFSQFCGTLILPDGPCRGLPYNPATHPPQACIAQAVDNGASYLVIVKPVQDGGSLIAFATMLWRTLTKGQTSIVAYPTLKAAGDAWTKKIVPMLTALDSMPTSGGGSGGSAASSMQLPGGGGILLRSAGGRHESGQASATGDVLLVDEADDWSELRKIALIEQRLAKSPEPMVVIVSTVKHDGDGVDASRILRLHANGTQTQLTYQCPECQGQTRLDWDNVDVDTERVGCEACGTLLTEQQRQDMLPTWQRLDAKTSDKFSIMWTSLDSPFPITLGGRRQPVLKALCTEYKEAQAAKELGDHSLLRQFYRDRLCRKYVGDQDKDAEGQTLVPTRGRLEAISADSELSYTIDQRDEDGDSIHFTEVPEWVEHQVVSVDVQSGGQRAPGRLYFLVMGSGGNRQAITGHGSVVAAPAGRQPTTAELHAALDKLDGLLRENSSRIVRRGVDIGDRQDELMQWLRRHTGYWALKGTEKSMKSMEGDLPGWVYHRRQDNGDTIRFIETQSCMSVVHGCLLGDVLTLPRGLDRQSALVKHLCATVQYAPGKWSSREQDRRHHPEWQKRHDYLDCAAYCAAMFYHYSRSKGSKPMRIKRRRGEVGQL